VAQVDYFLKVAEIKGESTDEKHKGEIEVESFSWGATQSGTAGHGGGGGAGKVSFQDFHFTHRFDKASPVLAQACATGQHFKEATLFVRKAGGGQQEYLNIKLEDSIVSSYQLGGSGGDVTPTDSFSLNFAKITLEYKEQKADGSLGGSVKGGFDLASGKKI
jgi:type VI secretion system secreted protein Hcp